MHDQPIILQERIQLKDTLGVLFLLLFSLPTHLSLHSIYLSTYLYKSVHTQQKKEKTSKSTHPTCFLLIKVSLERIKNQL